MYKRYNTERRDPEINKRYDDEWSQIRDQYIVSYPYCEICKKYGKLVRAVEVHHIKPLAEGGSNHFSNLISLCHRCHARIHAERGDYLGRKKTVYSY
jgi:5-methylcytosine-specific restriction protein A